jgi:hypothetical protein
MTTSILEQEYIEPSSRPYSQKELLYNKNKVYKMMRISKTRAHHKNCGHFYYVKENGLKEKEIKKSNLLDIGKCSVCWKIYRSPVHLKNMVKNLTTEYCNIFLVPPVYLTHENVDLEITFIKWLYEDISY